MSIKSSLLSVGVIMAIFLIGGYFYGEHKYDKGYDDAVATLTTDSTAVVIDTFYVKADTVTKYEWVLVNVADVDSSKDALVYSTQLDTSIVIEGDTVATLREDISFSDGVFAILMDLELRPVEKIVEITRTEFRTVKVPVPADCTFPNTWLTGFISGLILFLSMVLLL